MEFVVIVEIVVVVNFVVIIDEVYEYLVFDYVRYLLLVGFDGMVECMIIIFSVVKMFNCIGWKIGWVCGLVEFIVGVCVVK